MAKVNIQRPRPRHEARRLFEEVTKPIVVQEQVPDYEVCARIRQEKMQALQQASEHAVYDLTKQQQQL